MACHCGSAGGANVVDELPPARPFAKAFNALSIPCCFSALRYEKALQFAADHSDRYHDGIGAMVSPPMACGFHPRCRISSKNT